jgi:hypothetical protein
MQLQRPEQFRDGRDLVALLVHLHLPEHDAVGELQEGPEPHLLGPAELLHVVEPLDAVREAVEGYRTFMDLARRYADLVVRDTRKAAPAAESEPRKVKAKRNWMRLP